MRILKEQTYLGPTRLERICKVPGSGELCSGARRRELERLSHERTENARDRLRLEHPFKRLGLKETLRIFLGLDSIASESS